MTENTTEVWWKKHTHFKSDSFVKSILNAEPDEFCSVDDNTLQLARDFQKLKNRFINLCLWQTAQDEWDSLPEEEKLKQQQFNKKVEEKLHKLWESK